MHVFDVSQKDMTVHEQKTLLFTLSLIAQMVCLSPRMIQKMVKQGRFPRPVRIGRAVRWRANDVAQWVDDLGTGTAPRTGRPRSNGGVS